MSHKEPMEFILDETVPTKEQLDKLFSLARRVLDIAPWEFMGEPQVLAVQHDAKKTSFVIVTGEMGTYFSIQIYLSLCDLDAMLRQSEHNRQDMIDRMFELPQLKLVFSKKAELLPGDAERIKASGITFKNGKHPSFQSLMPGYDLAFPGGHEIERMTVCVEQLLCMLGSHRHIPVLRSPLEPICTRLLKEGRWEEEIKRHSLFQNLSFSLSQELLDQVLKLPKTNRPTACGCFVIPTHFLEKGSRPVMPRALLLMDVESQFIHGMELLNPEKGKFWDITVALNELLKQIINIGYRPSSLKPTGNLLQKVGKSFCSMIDVDYDDRPFKPMYKVFQEIISRFGG